MYVFIYLLTVIVIIVIVRSNMKYSVVTQAPISRRYMITPSMWRNG